jgi:outer membrane protein OmpA-like peptidoglycan-associated protein
MQRHELSRRHGAARAKRARTSGALLCLVLGACGGVTQFEDTTPISLRNPAPPPAPEPTRVAVTSDHIEISEKIQFAIDKADILPASHGLLNEVVEVLQKNPQIAKLSIIGHTDSDGADTYNQQLSDKRAKAVLAYFTSHGIDAARLTAVGKGEAAPIASNDTAAGREQNRRVEFLILEAGGAKP